MTNIEIETKVIQIAAAEGGVEPSQVTRDHAFVADLGFDSLDVMEMAMELEEVFEVNVPDDDLERLVTVGQVIDFVINAVNARPAAAH
jgi:acyl carrier protein